MGGTRFKVTNVLKSTSNVMKYFFKRLSKNYLEPQYPESELSK